MPCHIPRQSVDRWFASGRPAHVRGRAGSRPAAGHSAPRGRARAAPAWPSRVASAARAPRRGASPAADAPDRTAAQRRSGCSAPGSGRGASALDPQTIARPRSWDCPTRLREARNRRSRSLRPGRAESPRSVPSATPGRRDNSSRPRLRATPAPGGGPRGNRRRCARSRLPGVGPDRGRAG